MPTTSYVFKAVGGTDIVRLYKAIGDAADQQAQRTARANQRAAASTREAASGLRVLSGAMGEIRMAAEPFVAQLGPLSRGLSALSGVGVAGAAAAGIAGIGAALLVGAKRAADFADSLLEQATAIGISVTKFQELRFAAATYGVDQDKLSVALAKFTKSVGEAEQGTGGLVKQLKTSDPALLRLLQSTASVDVKFDAFTKKLQNASSASERMVLGAAAMGRGFAPLATMFAESADGLQALIDRAHATGAVIDEELIRKGAAASDAWDVFALSVKGVAAGALLELTGYLKASYDEASKLLELVQRARGMAPSAAILPDVRGAITEGPGGGITGKIAELERRLDEARKLQAGGFEGLPGIVGGTSVTETIDDLVRKLGELNVKRSEYVTQTRGTVAAEDAAAKSAREQAQALDAYGKIVEKLKPDLAAINQLEKERLDIINKAQKTGAVDPAEAERAREQVRKEATEARTGLDAKAVAAAKAQLDARKRVAEEVKNLENAAALAPLEGIERIDKERDQALERFKERIGEQGFAEEDYNRIAVALTADAEAQKAKIREKEAEKLAKEQETAAKEADRLAKDALKERERLAEEAAKPFLEAAQSIAQDLSSALVDSFLAGEGQAKDSAEVIKDIFRNLAEDLVRLFVEKAILEPLATKVTAMFAGAAPGATPTPGVAAGMPTPPPGTIVTPAPAQGGYWWTTPTPGATPVWVAAPGQGAAAAPNVAEIGGGVISGLKSLLGLFGGGAAGGAATLPAMFAGATPTAAGLAVPGLTSLPAGVAGPVMTEAAAADMAASSASLASGASSLVSAVAGIATVGVALYQAGQQMVASRERFDQATLGTAQSEKNTLTGMQGGLIAGFTAGGAAIGSVVPLIGTAAGAAVGAAVGTAVSKALEEAVTKGIAAGVKGGISQAQLESTVVKETSSDLLLNILSGGLNAVVIAKVLAPLVTPDINEIFGKMFRMAIGGGEAGGGLDTSKVPVGSTDRFGLKEFASEAQRASRIIAEAIGAGGEAFAGERAKQFTSILLGGVRARMDATGEDAALVLGDAFVGAFGGRFFAALKTAAATGLDRQKEDFALVAKEFTRGSPAFGFNYRALAGAVSDEGNIPLMKARRASQEAVGKSLQAALADAADSGAFRKSMTGAVTDAFAAAASSALIKGPLGEAFAPFFSVSNVQPAQLKRARMTGDQEAIDEIEARGLRNRRELRKARREGDVEAESGILKREFIADVKNFTAVVSDPAFLAALKELTDATLTLHIAASLAADDTAGAADAIEQRLLPQIQLLEQAAELSRDIRTRVALAQEEPGGLGAQRANIAELRRERQEMERQFSARTGGNTLEDFRRLIEEKKGPEDVKQAIGLNEALKDPQRLMAALQEFAQARLAELEAELAMVQAMVSQLESAQRTVRDFQERIREARGIAPVETKVEKARRLGAVATFGQFLDPESVAAFFGAMEEALAEATQQVEAMKAAAEAFGKIADAIAQSLDPSGAAARAQLGERMGDVRALVAKAPKVLAEGGEAAAELGADLQEAIQEAASIATAQRDFFKAAREGFERLAESVRDILDPEGRGARAAADVARLLPAARKGDQEAITLIQAAIGESIQLANQQREFFKAARKGFEGLARQVTDLFDPEGTLGRTLGDLNKVLPGARAGKQEDVTEASRLIGQAIGIASQRRETARGLAEGFGDLGEQAATIRGGRRAQRGQLASRRDELAALLPKALAGDLEALAKAQKLSGEVLALGQSTLRGGRLRGLAGDVQSIVDQLEKASEGQIGVAEQQLTALQKLATSLGFTSGTFEDKATAQLVALEKLATSLGFTSGTFEDAATAQLVELQAIAASLELAFGGASSVAQKSLDELQDIADDAAEFIDTKLPTVLGTLTTLQGDFTTFKAEMQPVIDYLAGTAGVTIEAQLSALAGLLIRANFTQEGNIWNLLDTVRKRLPQAAAVGASAEAGQPFLIGERGPEFFVPRVAGTILPHGMTPQTAGGGTVVTVNLSLTVAPPAGMTRAQADEYGRSLLGPFERAAVNAVRRAMPRKVA